MMNLESIEPVFCLSGCGYLHELVESKGKVIARIKILTDYGVNNCNFDDVTLDCEVENKQHLFRLRAFAHKVTKGFSVILNFKVKYLSFVSAHAGQTADDPDSIVTFYSKLLLLEDCYVNGHLAKEYLRLAAAA